MQADMKNIKFLDCTLRDGGYYNSWDFTQEVITKYLGAMQAAGVDIVELGLRSLNNTSFNGACAYTTDDFLESLSLESLTIGVMINASELVGELPLVTALERLFPAETVLDTPVSLVRIACHVHEFKQALPAVSWLKARGYQVGFNLMQVADRSEDVIKALAAEAAKYP